MVLLLQELYVAPRQCSSRAFGPSAVRGLCGLVGGFVFGSLAGTGRYLQNISDRYQTVVRVKSATGSLFVVFVYIPLGADHETHMARLLNAWRSIGCPSNFIVGGDFNASSALWSAVVYGDGI